RASLDAAATSALAERVRAFVAGADGVTLPLTLEDGRPAFDARAVSHLVDVRYVLRGAWIAAGIAAVLAAAWTMAAVRTGRRRELAASLTGAAWGTAGAVALAVLGAVVDFDWFFTAFHAAFFAPSTWQFPADALLIRLFPEPFWAVSGAVWGAGALLAGAGYAFLGRQLGRGGTDATT
ncbi:MAG TPA: DUF1461 domain-containing protein, partial [Coriobacteriia bacterium]|nr:DUF1461 domain-containing protein [Coriobacteriia bacterium]